MHIYKNFKNNMKMKYTICHIYVEDYEIVSCLNKYV